MQEYARELYPWNLYKKLPWLRGIIATFLRCFRDSCHSDYIIREDKIGYTCYGGAFLANSWNRKIRQKEHGDTWRLDYAATWAIAAIIDLEVITGTFVKSPPVVECRNHFSIWFSEFCNFDYVMQELDVWSSCKWKHSKKEVELPSALCISDRWKKKKCKEFEFKQEL